VRFQEIKFAVSGNLVCVLQKSSLRFKESSLCFAGIKFYFIESSLRFKESRLQINVKKILAVISFISSFRSSNIWVSYIHNLIKITFQRIKFTFQRIKFYFIESSFIPSNQVVVKLWMISIVHRRNNVFLPNNPRLKTIALKLLHMHNLGKAARATLENSDIVSSVHKLWTICCGNKIFLGIIINIFFVVGSNKRFVCTQTETLFPQQYFLVCGGLNSSVCKQNSQVW